MSRDHIRELCADTWYPTWECKVSGTTGFGPAPNDEYRACDDCGKEMQTGQSLNRGRCYRCYRRWHREHNPRDQSAYSREYHAKNRDRILANQRRWRTAQGFTCTDCGVICTPGAKRCAACHQRRGSVNRHDHDAMVGA